MCCCIILLFALYNQIDKFCDFDFAQNATHRLHYRDHDSYILRSSNFDNHFNMSDLPPSEEEFLASSKDSSHVRV